MAEHSAAGVSEWATKSGSVWARRWRDTDRGLSGLAPHLLSAILDRAPPRAFRAFDIGCGPGSTTIDLATTRSDAEVSACDVSADLAEIARVRTGNLGRLTLHRADGAALLEAEALRSPLGRALAAAGFAPTPRGLRLRGQA